MVVTTVDHEAAYGLPAAYCEQYNASPPNNREHVKAEATLLTLPATTANIILYRTCFRLRF